MAVAIQVQNLSKAYQIGQIGTGTISRDIERWLAKLRGKEDPFLKVGETNDRATKGASDIVWSLKDINFEIQQGDAVGIIGRNGAGKSTLLKLLSRVTSPTTGSIKAKGRIASLLEVGTGFHPELTGRENIYLNGAILGMRKKEIDKKLDQIIDFSGVERYVDTPVKRYSSGMYVRLAFAVAAHLESEILIVDEVLAVGDAEFQTKCLGKMNDVSKGEGRTILFVSHNMAAISTLCNNSIILNNGLIEFNGSVNMGIENYIRNSNLSSGDIVLDSFKHHKCVFSKLKSIQLFNSQGNITSTFFIGAPLNIRVGFELFQDVSNLEIGFCINNIQGVTLCGYVSTWDNFQRNFQRGVHIVGCTIPFLQTLPSSYSFTIWIKKVGENVDDEVERAIEFEVLGRDLNGSKPYFEKYNELNTYQPSTWTLHI
jgi:lipopolysaccharide transport system ATP-binding protein